MFKNYVEKMKQKKMSKKDIDKENAYKKEETIEYISSTYPDLSIEEIDFLWKTLKLCEDLNQKEIDDTLVLYTQTNEYKNNPNRKKIELIKLNVDESIILNQQEKPQFIDEDLNQKKNKSIEMDNLLQSQSRDIEINNRHLNEIKKEIMD